MKKIYTETGEVAAIEAETEAERAELMYPYGDYREDELLRARRQMALEEGCVPIRPVGWIWGSSYLVR